jgi:hypothetical protein
MKFEVVVTTTTVHRGIVEVWDKDIVSGEPRKDHEIKSEILKAVAGHGAVKWDEPHAKLLDNIGLDIQRVDE